MANYYVDIIDTTDDTHTTLIENAAARSIIINYEGKDAKDELVIMGSSIQFTMEVPHDNNVDGAFLHLFTGNETKYNVQLKKEVGGTIVQQGFLLPDSYSEPYTQGNFFVDFEATDGLGRLKGKYLPDTFYEDEHTVTDIVCKCLELTGLQLDVYIAPAIQHSVDKLWHTKYIDGLNFVDRNKKQTAYKILETICGDWLSTCFQTSNQWRIEGWNYRNQVSFTAQKYAYDGTYDSEVQITRTLKNIKGITLQTPIVTMVPPYKTVTVTHERVQQNFPSTIAKETNDGWAEITGVTAQTYATDWKGNNGCYAYALAPDYEVVMFPNGTASFDVTKFISLRRKIYLASGEKVKILIQTANADPNFLYDIKFNDDIIFSNRTGDVTTNEIWSGSQGNYQVAFEYVTTTEGLIDVIFYQTLGVSTTSPAWKLKKLDIDIIGFEDEFVATNTINEDYSLESDVELTFADDASGASNSFLLAKLREDAVTFNEIQVPIKYGYTQNGKHYSIVDLDGANLINENNDQVYVNTTQVTVLEVIYNLNNGEEMVVVTSTPYTSGNFLVRVYAVADYTDSRATWQQWADAVYPGENTRYAQVAANVVRRMFLVPHQKVDVTVKAAIRPDDIVVWDYLLQSNYIITNCSWDIDAGESTITMVKAVYQNTIIPQDNEPPVVDAGSDIIITESATTANLNATAYDLDGFIASYLWQKLSGIGGVIATPLEEDTALSDLTDDEYEYQITVTDNEGATASDTVKIFREKEYTFSLTALGCTTPEPNNGSVFQNKQCTYQLAVTPALPDDFVMLIEGEYRIENYNNDEALIDTESTIEITKNASIIHSDLGAESEIIIVPFSINFINSHDLRWQFYMKCEDLGSSESPLTATASFTLTINNISFVSGSGTISGLPLIESESISL